MLIEGRYEIEGVSRERVFAALSDPAILARAVPGCQELVDRGDGVYDLTIEAGVGAVRGTYAGQVRIGERREPDRYAATLDASGGAGAVRAELRADLEDARGSTIVAYAMDASLTGPIAGVGQRVLAGASRRNATLFLHALGGELTAGPAAAAAAAAGAEPTGPAGGGATPAGGEPAGGPAVYAGRAAAGAAGDYAGAFQRGLLVGFALALLGVAVGAILGRRRGQT